ncbi:hypothetical protein Mal64_11780 [Pseudobythopirellula maris]|uniref:Uncharacterized protein n=1 Tax=Pseudobythopirellula maris TaxID=2527991 RepID=A0A5C5ZV26_9BACT|nr:hypothetical protein [Pseudobythopirellula maris]TWT90781.1 hypothetical protein Mal64_11780 [Pseudobythopirellula maris]
MDAKKIELAPVALYSLAGIALALAAIVPNVRFGPPEVSPRPIDRPLMSVRTADRPGNWSQAIGAHHEGGRPNNSLSPVGPYLADWQYNRLRPVIGEAAPSPTVSPLTAPLVLSDADLMHGGEVAIDARQLELASLRGPRPVATPATEARADSEASGIVVLVPSQPRWSAPLAEGRSVDRWSLFGWDGVAGARAVGKAYAALQSRVVESTLPQKAFVRMVRTVAPTAGDDEAGSRSDESPEVAADPATQPGLAQAVAAPSRAASPTAILSPVGPTFTLRIGSGERLAMRSSPRRDKPALVEPDRAAAMGRAAAMAHADSMSRTAAGRSAMGASAELGETPTPWADITPLDRAPRAQRKPADAADLGGVFPHPAALVEQIERVRHGATATWAAETLDRTQAVTRVSGDTPGVEAEQALAQLAASAAEAARIAERLDGSVATELRRLRYAIDRRVDAWRLSLALRQNGKALLANDPAEVERRLRDRLARLESGALARQGGDAWRSYLMTEELDRRLGRTPHGPLAKDTLDERRRLAQQVLGRMQADQLSADQKRFLTSAPLAALGDDLRALAAPASVDVAGLARRVEAYELAPSASAGEALARDIVRLARLSDPDAKSLSEELDRQYRNGNLRVAISDELIERFLPAPEVKTRGVHTRVAGTPVRGVATTRTNLSLELVPNSTSWRLLLGAEGRVDSKTRSTGGPASVFTQSVTRYHAQKTWAVGPTGVSSEAAVATASNQTRLVGLKTRLDGAPLLGDFVRSRARQGFRDRRGVASNQTEARVRREAAQQLDERGAEAVEKLLDHYRSQTEARAEALGMRVEPVEMRTTERRLIARLRVAGAEQLAAHTPRMRAPGDSLASVQIHESLLNNALRGVIVPGEEIAVADLRVRLAERFASPVADADEDAARAVIRFADTDPLSVRFRDGRVGLTLAVAEFRLRGDSYRNFKVHTSFTPQLAGMEARLVRDGTPQIEGKLRTGKRLRLHAAFGKALGGDRSMPLYRLTPDTERKLEGLMATQLVVEDGWIGYAIGPATASRLASCGGYVR